MEGFYSRGKHSNDIAYGVETMRSWFSQPSSSESPLPHTRSQRPSDSRSNQYEQRRQDENPVQYQVPHSTTTPSHSYQEVPGGHHQQPYPQRTHSVPIQTPEPREATTHSRSRKNKSHTIPRTPLFRESELKGPANIVIFGETGTGKSSLINMLSDEGTAAVSNLAVGCTFESAPYPVSIDGVRYTLWDSAGLNEGDAGSVPGDIALHHLRDLVNNLNDGISLLVYCIRGSRYRDIIKVNYDLFTEIICQREVPVVIVVTGLENEECMEDWWKVNEKEFTGRGMKFHGHACITTSKGKKNMFEEEYEESLVAVRALIQKCCPKNAWVVGSEEWFDRITLRIQEYYDTYNGYSHEATERYSSERGGSSRLLAQQEKPLLYKFAEKLITFLLS
ncbi:hypothetical protein AGABI2DRAFT_195950 [Agaricus bisporus var. bisporus H97]|uniref:hypothetical protein n=1 Tax=Agaricus bisporus var. bisporus (strain H97 / ATCC MYA-4626 / FGSC 10389) TaxID=936046 RepID=UPI00029F6CDC|nr:hypothetical protein AGABI2DRAFT_195950 [Agaricus bisporus var. bisporus H97]EKV42214.1 hypothetical protein AGABI2DRAFT_195950 [Agaricus bisporus var. bisporus H97]